MFALIHCYSVTFNATSLEIVVTAIKDGVFEVAYNCSKAGAYWMSVTINGSEIGTRAPGMVVVQPNSVYPPACFAIGDATSEAIVKVFLSLLFILAVAPR